MILVICVSILHGTITLTRKFQFFFLRRIFKYIISSHKSIYFNVFIILPLKPNITLTSNKQNGIQQEVQNVLKFSDRVEIFNNRVEC